MGVPVNERYTPDFKNKSRKFFVNSTWLRYGADIINEAIYSKKVMEKARKQQSGSLQNFGTTTGGAIEGSAVGAVPTSELLSHLVDNRGGATSGSFMMMSQNLIPDDESTASRFAVTRDRIVADGGDDTDEEREDVNNASTSNEEVGKRISSHAFKNNVGRTRTNGRRKKPRSPSPGTGDMKYKLRSKSPSKYNHS